ncbi:MAG TPA: methyltransferase domain-containing protein [Phototrophicaceae bacterium]|nr:methyltransferase domain-containing protein [Phototrophicaceae bacterium]
MFEQLINRHRIPSEWQKIPWHDPDFSRRMLREHLAQDHDAASRRQTIIDYHVAWIHHQVLAEEPAAILDLGCGPGFYADRLSHLGHTVTGIDISPASIDYACQHSTGTFIHGDVRIHPLGTGYDLAMMVYGELNAFAPSDAAAIIDRTYEALKPGGQLLLEVHNQDVVKRLGQEPATWHTAASGVFSDQPYLCLSESAFENDSSLSHYYVIDIASGAMTHYLAMHQAYTDAAYRHLLRRFNRVEFYPSLAGEISDTGQEHLFVIVAGR